MKRKKKQNKDKIITNLSKVLLEKIADEYFGSSNGPKYNAKLFQLGWPKRNTKEVNDIKEKIGKITEICKELADRELKSIIKTGKAEEILGV